jgi:hypothetical protein
MRVGAGKNLILAYNFPEPETWPILACIWDSFRIFYKEFAKKGRNWEKLPVLYHPLLTNRRGGGVNMAVFERNFPPIDKAMAETLLVKDVWHNGNMKSLYEITLIFNSLCLATYMRIANYFREGDGQVLKQRNEGQEGISVINFVQRFKKGSKNFRLVIQNKNERNNKKVCEKSLKKFLSICDVAATEAVLALDIKAKILAWWDFNVLPNRIRDFLFKYTHNILGLNARVAHYNQHINAACTLCTIEKKNPPRRNRLYIYF